LKKRRKVRYDRIVIFLVVIALMVFGLIKKFDKEENVLVSNKDNLMLNFINKTEEEIKNYATKNSLNLNITYEYNDEIEKGNIISQSIDTNSIIKENDNLDIVVSLGKIDKEKLKEDKINELGNIPIMMYHGIINKKDSQTDYIGGNVDKDGYNRTTESFREDLEFYYNNDYRMVRLIDYVNGNINTEYGKSPIVLTFDDGNDNNLKVTGLDEEGNIIIDPNSAVGILEEFKKKYPDFNVTATFFVNDSLFNQKEYNEKILNFLVDNGYDVGNHTKGHANFSNIDTKKTQEVVGYVYKQLDNIIPDKYVKIVALPFGSPYSKTHENYNYILKGTYDNYQYETEAALRVGWEAELSPFNNSFDKTFLKRCRAYDNNGKDFDIEMNFRILENKRYISDGNNKTIVTSSDNENIVNNSYDLEVIYY